MSNKKSLKVITIVLVIFILLFAASLFGLYTFKAKVDESQAKITELETEIEANKQFVYVAVDDLTAGTVIETGVNVVIQNCVTALPSSSYVSDLDDGKVLVVDVAANEPVMANMVTDEVFQNDTREIEVGLQTLCLTSRQTTM